MVYSSMERELVKMSYYYSYVVQQHGEGLVKMSYYYSYGVQQHGEGACEDELLL